MYRWSAIAAELPGRTDNEIKNHWHTNLKKRFNQNSITEHAQITKSKPEKTQMNEKQTNSKPMEPVDIDAIYTPKVLESSSTASSPQPSSSITEDRSYSGLFESYTADDFWTEPFLSDNSYNFNVSSDFVTSSFMDSGYVAPFLEEEMLLCSYGLY